MTNNSKKEFWVTNMCNKNVSLIDLNITIPAFKSMNLLNNNCKYTLEQLQKSAESGSLFKKRKMISVRKNPPQVIIANKPLLQETFIPCRSHSVYEQKQEIYDELLISDEEFANENAEIAEIDRTK